MALNMPPVSPEKKLAVRFGDDQPVRIMQRPIFGLADSIRPLEGDVFQPVRNAVDNVVPLFRQVGKELHVVKFGALSDPLKKQKPALQMRVTGVTRYQYTPDKFDSNGPVYTEKSPMGPINRLAQSEWKDGQRLDFDLESNRWGNRINLSIPGFGPIGRVPDEISRTIYSAVSREPGKFRFELSNLIAGMTKGAETIGLRINLIYEGDDPGAQDDVRTTFNAVLNDPKASHKVMIYQPPVSPEDVLKLILENEKQVNGARAAAQMKKTIDAVVARLKDPANKRILLLGHCKPDGDTLGCITGLKNAIQLMDPTRQVDIAVDDKIPGLFRNKVPGMDEIKHPYNPEKIAQVQKLLEALREKQAKPGTSGEKPEVIASQIRNLEIELAALQNKANLLDPDAQYDLVVTMDIPTPTRFTDKFKPYFDRAKDVVYIDHHPHRFNEWEAAKGETGLDMKRVHDRNLAWVADKVGACAQMMTIIGNRLVPQLDQIASGQPVAKVLPKEEQQRQLARYVANLVTGMSTDTGSFTRTCNLTPDDMRKPVEQRPNFYPEGTAKWLMDLTRDLPADVRIDKKWLRENVTYDLPDNLLSADDQFTARDLMLKHAVAGKVVHPDLSLGFIEVDYDQMKEVWDSAREVDPEVNLLDVQNGFKYSEAMGVLRSDPEIHKNSAGSGQDGKSLTAQARENYQGKYDKDRIAILICQDKKAGQLDEKLQIATTNGLRLSLRSENGSEHAELLASLFGGGGHGAAAGGRVDLPGVGLDTPLGVKIRGHKTSSAAQILKTLRHNMKVNHNTRLSDADKKRQTIPVEVVLDPEGQKITDLIRSVVAEIRKEQPVQQAQPQKGKAAPKKSGRR